MKILIVEDDENKRQQISDFIGEIVPQAEISIAKSYQSGLKQVIAKNTDLILLDMTMPTFDIGIDEDGGRPQAYAGREILRQMDRREIVTPVIIITQFDKFGEGIDELTLPELDHQLYQDHPQIYQGAIYYSAALGIWKELLGKVLGSLQNKIEKSNQI